MLKWNVSNDSTKFAEAVVPLLERDEHLNGTNLRVLNKVKGKPVDDKLRLATIEDNGEIVCVIQQTLPFQMLYYFGDNKWTDRYIDFFVENLIKQKWDIAQVSADEVSAKIFA